MDINRLESLGLTKTEIRIYTSSLVLGPSLASALSERTGIERAVTYHTLTKLIHKGLIGYVIRENRRYFSAAPPDRLRGLLREKEEMLNDLIPELATTQHESQQSLTVEVFRGKEGFKTVLDDMLTEARPYSIIGYTHRGTVISPVWYHHWEKRRVAQKIVRRLLIPKGMHLAPTPYTQSRVLSMHLVSKSSIIIYGNDKVLLFLPLQEFAGIRIQNKETHLAYQSYFDILWAQSASLADHARKPKD